MRSHYVSPRAYAAVLVRRSLLMLPALVVSAATGGLIGFWMLSARGLEGSDPIAEQGAYGWLVRILTNGVVLVAPSYAGLWWAIRARRLGAGSLALVAVAVHLTVIGAVWTLIAVAT
ncbi:MAG: hypothetical protein ACO3C1_04795 [Ilumatobacteraceae bacterium]